MIRLVNALKDRHIGPLLDPAGEPVAFITRSTPPEALKELDGEHRRPTARQQLV